MDHMVTPDKLLVSIGRFWQAVSWRRAIVWGSMKGPEECRVSARRTRNPFSCRVVDSIVCWQRRLSFTEGWNKGIKTSMRRLRWDYELVSRNIDPIICHEPVIRVRNGWSRLTDKIDTHFSQTSPFTKFMLHWIWLDKKLKHKVKKRHPSW